MLQKFLLKPVKSILQRIQRRFIILSVASLHTIDPERDSVEHLATFVPWFDRRFLGLWGDAATIAATAQEFHVFYQKQETGSAAGYAMDHTAGSYVFDPQGRLRLFERHGDSPESMVADLRLLLAGK